MLAEEAIQDFLKTHSLPVALILPGWMFGPYDAAPTDSGRLVLDFLAGKLPGIIEGGSTVVDARDVAQAMVAAVERGQSGRRYIVAGEFQSIENIVHTLSL
jgi:dihydroflavonol-4-reductase